MPHRILVIDDDADMRRLLADHVLNRPGWKVVALPDAYQALVELRHATFDVVVADHVMPGATGIDLLRRLERSVVDVPVIVVSALVPGPIGDDALAAGAVAVVPKDRVEVDLVPTIENAIASGRLGRSPGPQGHLARGQAAADVATPPAVRGPGWQV